MLCLLSSGDQAARAAAKRGRHERGEAAPRREIGDRDLGAEKFRPGSRLDGILGQAGHVGDGEIHRDPSPDMLMSLFALSVRRLF